MLRLADEYGLVHLTINQPGQMAFALCSCCTCCCHDLQWMLKYGRTDLIARSAYMARDRSEDCLHCGQCVSRCVFGAREEKDGQVVYHPEKCYGCGLCVSTCPNEVISLVTR